MAVPTGTRWAEFELAGVVDGVNADELVREEPSTVEDLLEGDVWEEGEVAATVETTEMGVTVGRISASNSTRSN